MRLHLAAVHSNDMHKGGRYYAALPPHAQRHRDEVPWLLESYHYFNKPEQIDRLRMSGEKVFLDSGAFSAWSQGVDIDLPGYCRFIQEYEDCFTVASVLDVIGSAEGTWENQQKMERLGTKPIPCYHYGEDPRWCEYYAANYEYMALGGFGVATRKDMREWLDEIWEKHLTDGSGRAKTKVHGFAVTAQPLMERYPWWSVDSSSWVQISSVGGIINPDYGVISVSSTSPGRKIEGQHFNTFSALEQVALAKHFASLGYSVDELRDSYMSRRTYCMWAYSEMNRRLDTHGMQYARNQMGLF